MDVNRLTPEEQEALSYLVNKANGGSTAPGIAPPVPEDRKFGEAPPPNPATVTRVIPPEEWVDKQINTLSAVGEANYRAGITRPKKNPIEAGIAAQPKYEAAMRDPATLKRRESSLRKTNMDEWAAMSEKVGAGRLVAGVTERRFKVERFVAGYQPKLAAHLRTVDAMPDVTDADRERRMVENLRGLKKIKGTV